ncbi:glycoside hydrolase family 88 protein [Planctomycetota bacterium]
MKIQLSLVMILGFFLSFFLFGCAQQPAKRFTVQRAQENLNFSMVQYEAMHQGFSDRANYPNCILPDGTTRYIRARDWTSGFYPGSLWYLYEYSGDDKFKKMAMESNAALEEIKTYGGTHDLGFMLYGSFGHGLRLAQVPGYRDILVQGARTLATRYNPTVGCTLSWSWGASRGWEFPVIIDNMMNLEYLFWAARETGEDAFRDMAVSHARTTMKHHFRDDSSCYHVVDYDPNTGEVRWRGTHQGNADDSAWARGQAWGLYGYTMVYRETKQAEFLEQAKRIAQFLLEHPSLPEDLVPYWDYNAPQIPDEPRDTSAAALMASALLELSTYVEEPTKSEYWLAAEKILDSLCSPAYRAEVGENNHFLLMHSVGNYPRNSQVDTPINYTDYYFIEALTKYLKLSGER